LTIRVSTVRGQGKQQQKKQITEHHNGMIGLEVYVPDHLQPIKN